jgi:hypothetical protein
VVVPEDFLVNEQSLTRKKIVENVSVHVGSLFLICNIERMLGTALRDNVR